MSKTIKHFENRNSMISQMVKQNGKIAEIGVLQGDFAQEIQQRCKPSELHLVDLWPSQMESGDVDGNNMTTYLGTDCMRRIRQTLPKAVLQHMSSENYLRIAHADHDMIYLDADHEYEGVKADLIGASRCLKPNGLLMGHDFAINPEKGRQFWEFGVARAVHEFVNESDWSLVALAWDGCVSFCLARA